MTIEETKMMASGCKYRRGEWLIEVYYNDDGQLVAENPRTRQVVPVITLPSDGWVETDGAWTVL